MDKRFKIAGVKYLRWKHNGVEFNATLEGVREFGKEFFEEEFKDYTEELSIEADEIVNTQEGIDAIISRDYGWLREQEIM